MLKKVLICVDEDTCKNPEFIGLDGELLERQAWLHVLNTGEEARRLLQECEDIQEAWVVSCADLEPINVAATLKADKPTLQVSLVSSEACGSLFSRAHTAGIDEVLNPNMFVRKYANTKRRLLEEPNSSDLEIRLPPPTTLSGFDMPEATTRFEASALALGKLLQPQFTPTLPRTRRNNRAFVLTVVSGSGGAGKSTVAALGALIARNMGRRTLLLDCDLQFGDVASLLGIDSPLEIDAAMTHPDRFESLLAADSSLAVLAAPDRLETAEEVVSGLPAMLEQFEALFDVVIVNTGASWAEQHALLLERSSAALFLIDQRVSSVRACNHALELCARCGIASSPFQFALNRCSKVAPLSSIDVSCALQGAPVLELKDGGRDVEDYLSGGAADELIESKNEFTKSLERVMARLLPGGNHQASRVDSDRERRATKRRGRHAERRRSNRR